MKLVFLRLGSLKYISTFIFVYLEKKKLDIGSIIFASFLMKTKISVIFAVIPY
jgi:hypothetical protein